MMTSGDDLFLFFISRLPILQGGTFTLLAPSMAMLSMPEWSCPAWTQNASLVNTSSPEFIEVWQSRMRAVSKPFDLYNHNLQSLQSNLTAGSFSANYIFLTCKQAL